MKFENFLYFYAVISCPSLISTRESRRKAIKQAVDQILGEPDPVKAKMWLCAFPSEENVIKELLGFSLNKDARVFEQVIVEIKKDITSIKKCIDEDRGEDHSLSYQRYLESKLPEVYPELDEYQNALITWQSDKLHNSGIRKPQPPVLVFNIDSKDSFYNISLMNNRATETQPLLDNVKSKNCKPCCSIL